MNKYRKRLHGLEVTYKVYKVGAPAGFGHGSVQRQSDISIATKLLAQLVWKDINYFV